MARTQTVLVEGQAGCSEKVLPNASLSVPSDKKLMLLIRTIVESY
jgi:hypothetical protein